MKYVAIRKDWHRITFLFEMPQGMFNRAGIMGVYFDIQNMLIKKGRPGYQKLVKEYESTNINIRKEGN